MSTIPPRHLVRSPRRQAREWLKEFQAAADAPPPANIWYCDENISLAVRTHKDPATCSNQIQWDSVLGRVTGTI